LVSTLPRRALPRVKLTANFCRGEFARARVEVAHLAVFAVNERLLNDLFDKMRNKSAASFHFVARHMDHLLRTYADQHLTIFCDRQGGRSHYGPTLRTMWPDWHLEITSESDTLADYTLTQSSRRVRIVFAEKGESHCMSVAVGSMLAKYFREMLMHRFNAYWHHHAPTLTPTAGYWTDGHRFIQDITPLCEKLGINPASLQRQR
jgi:hypothetical protein